MATKKTKSETVAETAEAAKAKKPKAKPKGASVELALFRMFENQLKREPAPKVRKWVTGIRMELESGKSLDIPERFKR